MTTWAAQIATDSRGALRALRRTPGFFVAAVATTAVGVGALTGVFSVINGVVLSPLPYPDPHQLVVVYNHYPTLDVLRGPSASRRSGSMG